ncbi:MAG TPA: ATP-binding protein [Candidatus Nanoarchaeia archaeon]|nr:ATP-binding protein [Candidatus Nanoarchaeia archaeon]
MDQQIQIALEKQNPWWFKEAYETGIPRLRHYHRLQKYLGTQEILLVLGARRTGKSTLLYQIIAQLKASPEAILFINLDEPIFQSKADDPAFLGTLIEEYLVQHKELSKVYVFIDEVQNYLYWTQTIKSLHDINKKVKFVLSGSTSSLLKDAASTRLSGRYFATVIWPLTFQEYLEFSNMPKPSLLQKRQAANRYLQFGGFPRVVLEKDELLKQDLLKNYFQTIYLKDIIFPHKVRNNKDVFDLLYFVLSNAGTPFSYAKMAKTLNISADTVKEYLSYAEQSYLLYVVTKYDPSVRKQLANPRKIYCVDTGLINSISFKFSENRGRLMENLVFMSLIKKQGEVFYHREANECDFLVREGRKIARAIQVTLSLKEESVKKRELKGLLEALISHNLQEGFIVTEAEKEVIELEGRKIHVVPLYEWLEQDSH